MNNDPQSDSGESGDAAASRQAQEQLRQAHQQLQAANKALRSANEQLEQRVAQRTEELAAAFEHLRAEAAERQRVQQALAESETKYRTLVENASVGILLCDAKTEKIVEANRKLVEMTGRPLGELIGLDRAALYAPETAEQATREFRATVAGTSRMVESIFLAPDGRRTPVAIVGSAMALGGRRIVVGFVRDITDRKQAEEAIRRQLHFLQTLLDAIPHPVYYKDTDHRYLGCNQAFCELTGLPREKILGQTVVRLNPADQGARHHEIDCQVLADAAALVYEHTDYAGTDRERHLLFQKAPFKTEAGQVGGLVGTVTDITYLKRIEERLLAYQQQLRSMASQLSLTEERERRQLATELHDRIGQALALAKIRLGVLMGPAEDIPTDYADYSDSEKTNKSVKSAESAGNTSLGNALPEGVRAGLANILGLIEQTLADARSLTFQLSPPILYELGFEPAVEWLAEQIARQYGIRIDVADDGQDKPMEDDVRVVLFQAVRELLVNAAKHSRADRIRVALGVAGAEGAGGQGRPPIAMNRDWGLDAGGARAGRRIRVQVGDDGVGFDPAAVGPGASSGFGLFSLRERIGPLGGSFQIDAAPGKGCRVTLLAPLKMTNVE